MARFWPDKIIENIYFKEMASLVKNTAWYLQM